MRVPVSWLRELVDLPPDEPARAIGDALVRAGLEVEAVHAAGGDIGGPLVVGRVLDFAEETHRNGKTVRWCTVDVGEDEPRGIVCGARNFAVGDLVVVALPGAVLPGDFRITARKTYGHVSDGMIASARELGLGDDHSGILVLQADEAKPGEDAHDLLRLRDEVLDIAVTPDRGYCLSMRGVAREVAAAYGVPFRDPAATAAAAEGSSDATGDVEAERGDGWPVRLEDPGCDRFAAVTVTGFDPAAPSPRWLQRRVQLAGMRPISLAVDVTNAVMLELGQPIHAFDRARLTGGIVVRRARAGERLRTLDGADRPLDPDDLLVADDSGPIGLAGVMGGESTEISAGTSEILIEAAHWDPATIARTARRHKLSSEAARRFERGVDPALPLVAARRVAQLLVELGAGRVEPGETLVGTPPAPPTLLLDPALPGRLVGAEYPPDEVVRLLETVGCRVEPVEPGGRTEPADPGERGEPGEPAGGGRPGADVAVPPRLAVTPPTWRPDLTDPADLVEEVARLHGYDAIPSVLPVAPPGRGLTAAQRLRRRVGRALADAGYVEVLSYPFVGPADLDALGLPADDPRRVAVRLANPLSDEEPLLRTTLLPGLLAAARRNIGRGAVDVALFELGVVFRPASGADGGVRRAPRLPVDRRPTDEELARLEAAVPRQPHRVAVVLTGAWEPAGWWGGGRPASWADAVEAARVVVRAAGVELTELVVRADRHAPWHPGRCAALEVGGRLVGHAGELHPRVLEALGLPPRTAAMELELDALGAADRPVPAPRFSTFPVATQDVALVVDAAVPAGLVEAALREGAGPLLESIRLFDVYAGPQVGEGRRSLAYALRFRAPDRTLTAEEATAARDAAVARAAAATGAVLRS